MMLPFEVLSVKIIVYDSEIKNSKMIVARMTSRLDSKKIERERFGSHKRPSDLMIRPLGYVLQGDKLGDFCGLYLFGGRICGVGNLS
jgi:hypothetical protein